MYFPSWLKHSEPHSCLIVGSDVMGSYHELKISSILYIWKFSSPWWSAKKIKLLSIGEEKKCLKEWSIKLVNG